jgi:hypothetical protein
MGRKRKTDGQTDRRTDRETKEQRDKYTKRFKHQNYYQRRLTIKTTIEREG